MNECESMSVWVSKRMNCTSLSQWAQRKRITSDPPTTWAGILAAGWGSIIYALAFCAFNGKWEICCRSTCFKIEKRCERGVREDWLRCMSYVVKRRFRLIEKRQKQKQQHNRWVAKGTQNKKELGKNNNNNHSKKCEARYVRIWRVNKIMIQK